MRWINVRLGAVWAVLLVLGVFEPVFAGTLEDSLLSSASARLDVKGVEIALRRGAKASDPVPHPDNPSSMLTPTELVLAALASAKDLGAPLRAEGILRALFKRGARLTGKRDELFFPIVKGHQRIVGLLLEEGANPHARIYGYTPAELAIKYEQPELLTLFYSRGVPKVPPETIAQIQFVHAASIQNLDRMRSSLANGATVNSSDPAGHIAIVQLLSTPLVDPAGYDALVWLILQAKCDPGKMENSDEPTSAIHRAIERNSYSEDDYQTSAVVVTRLLEFGSDVSAQDYRGRTPLHYAASTGNYVAAEVLLRNGAKVSTRDSLRKTPLDLAKSRRVIEVLKAYGARE